jgi:hypothetical protein
MACSGQRSMSSVQKPATLLCAFALAVAGVQLAAPGEARAWEACTGSIQPSGEPQYSPCKGFAPLSKAFAYITDGLVGKQILVPRSAVAIVKAIFEKGERFVYSWIFDKHTVFGAPALPGLGVGCSFGYPGENRFVADKFGWNGLVDLPLAPPWHVVMLPVNRYVGEVDNYAHFWDVVPPPGGNLVDPGAAIANGVIAPTAKLRIGVAKTVSLGTDAVIIFNGMTMLADAPDSSFEGHVLTADIPISWINFPGHTINGYCPWPAFNTLVIAQDTLNSFVDWAELTIETSPPIVLIAGDQTLNFAAPALRGLCKVKKLVKSLAPLKFSPDLGEGYEVPQAIVDGTIGEIAGSAVPHDICSQNSRIAWADMLETIEGDGMIATTTDDMPQMPSFLNSDPAGFIMCDDTNGSSSTSNWMPNAPLAPYLLGAAKSMGVGTIDVITHSKAGVDLLEFMTGPWYKSAYSGHLLKIRRVATLSAPYRGTPLASKWLSGRGGDPLPLGKRDGSMLLNFPANHNDAFWEVLYDIILNKGTWKNAGHLNEWWTDGWDALDDKDKKAVVQYLADLFEQGVCDFMLAGLHSAVRLYQDPEEATKLTDAALRRGWSGNTPRWVTFGANADSTNDDKLMGNCGLLIPLFFNLGDLGTTYTRQCVMTDDLDYGVGLEPQILSAGYLVIGASRCSSWNPATGSCTNWTEFTHNDGVVDEWSARLSPRYKHIVLDKYTGHIGHSPAYYSLGPAIDTNADHTMIRTERVPEVWPEIKAALGLPTPPATVHSED